MTKLNIATVGTGIFASQTHLPATEYHSDKFHNVACFNRTRAKAEDFASKAKIPNDKVYESLEEILADPSVDVIDALLPVQFNYDTVKAAIDAGKPIQIEKPIAANLEQARKIVELSHKTELPIAIAENWLYLNATKFVKEKLPLIGKVVGFSYSATGPFVSQNKYLTQSTWRSTPEHIGGFLSDGGVHQLAALCDILGEVETVSAHTTQVRQASAADDVVFSTLKLASGAIGTFTYGSAFGATEKKTFLVIYGDNGSIVYDFSNKKNPTVAIKIGENAEAKPIENLYTLEEDISYGVNEEFGAFYEAVSKKDKSLIRGSPEVAFHHLAIVAAFLESSKKNGSSVTVEKP